MYNPGTEFVIINMRPCARFSLFFVLFSSVICASLLVLMYRYKCQTYEHRHYNKIIYGRLINMHYITKIR